ncbi:MAG: cell division protein FtsL [Betaproteobacteria bacterium]|nr:cell division protein FtsL [Betaproteobacteria bacterium]
MIRLNMALLMLLAGFALGVVTVRHEAQRLFIELDQARAQAHDLKVEWGQLQLEQSTWGMQSRIERIATRELGMSVPDPSQIHIAVVPTAGLRRGSHE